MDVRLVEPHSKVSLSTEQEEDEHTNMEHTYQGCSQSTDKERERGNEFKNGTIRTYMYM